MSTLVLLALTAHTALAADFVIERPRGVDANLENRDRLPDFLQPSESLTDEAPGGRLRHANAPAEYLDRARQVVLDVCASGDVKEVSFSAAVLEDGVAGASFSAASVDPAMSSGTTPDCRWAWRAPFEGDFQIEADVEFEGGGGAFYTAVAQVRDLWMVSFGDSYASGEGAPDRMDDLLLAPYGSLGFQSYAAHRSHFGWPHLVAIDVQDEVALAEQDWQVLFSFLPASGAAISKGILDRGHNGPENLINRQGPSQLEQAALIGQALRLHGSDPARAWLPVGAPSPDLVVMDAGGNDVAFGDVVKECVGAEGILDGCSEELREGFADGSWVQFEGTELEGRHPFDVMDENHDRLAEAMDRVELRSQPEVESGWEPFLDDYAPLSLRPSADAAGPGVFLVGYPDVFIDEEGDPWGLCVGMYGGDVAFAQDEVLFPLNDHVQSAADEHGYTFVDMETAFDRHGVCSSDNWINDVLDSLAQQHNHEGIPDINGTVHPNRQGFLQGYRPRVSPPVTAFVADRLALQPDARVPEFTTEFMGPDVLVGDAMVVVEAAPGVRIAATVDGVEVAVAHTLDGPWELTIPEPEGPGARTLVVERWWEPHRDAPCVERMEGACEPGIPLVPLEVILHHDPADTDGDGWYDFEDGCPDIYEYFQIDIDGDGHNTSCDNCVFVANPHQFDLDHDGQGDECDEDDDDDGVDDGKDNCPDLYNPEQDDENGDGVGSACDEVERIEAFIGKIEALREAFERYTVGIPQERELPDWGCLDCKPGYGDFVYEAWDAAAKEASVFASDTAKSGVGLHKAKDGTVELSVDAMDAHLMGTMKLDEEGLAARYKLVGIAF
jgi:hypothetical protein